MGGRSALCVRGGREGGGGQGETRGEGGGQDVGRVFETGGAGLRTGEGVKMSVCTV